MIFSRYTWICPIKLKSDVLHVIPHFIYMIANQFHGHLKVFLSDNAPELHFTDLFSELGIIHQFSCVQTPQQNAIVERKHKHLLNVARALCFQPNLPTQFWIESILTATFLINRTPSKVLNLDTPYARLHNSPPSYINLRVFGCLAFVSIFSAGMNKFEPRARLYVFIGYPPGVKGCKLLDFHTHEIFISRDVIFHEDVFPFKTTNPTGFNSDPFDTIALPRLDHPTPPIIDHSHTLPITDHFPHHITTSDPTPAQPRKYTRNSKKSNYLLDYHCNQASISQAKYHISNVLIYVQLSLHIKVAFLTLLWMLNQSSIIKQSNSLNGNKPCQMRLMLLNPITPGPLLLFPMVRLL